MRDPEKTDYFTLMAQKTKVDHKYVVVFSFSTKKDFKKRLDHSHWSAYALLNCFIIFFSDSCLIFKASTFEKAKFFLGACPRHIRRIFCKPTRKPKHLRYATIYSWRNLQRWGMVTHCFSKIQYTRGRVAGTCGRENAPATNLLHKVSVLVKTPRVTMWQSLNFVSAICHI